MPKFPSQQLLNDRLGVVEMDLSLDVSFRGGMTFALRPLLAADLKRPGNWFIEKPRQSLNLINSDPVRTTFRELDN